MTSFDPRALASIPDPFAAGVSEALPPVPSVAPLPRAPARAQVRRTRTVALVLALLAEVAVIAVLGVRADLPASALATFVEVAVPLAAAGLALAAAVRRGPLGLGERRSRLLAFLGLGLAAFVIAALANAAPDLSGAAFWAGTEQCFEVSAVLAIGPLALGLFAVRRAFVAGAVWRTAAIGVAAGALAATSIAWICPHRDAMHVLLGHGTMMLLAGAVGALVGRSVARA